MAKIVKRKEMGMTRVVDLFAGAGGLSEGFRQAGFVIDTCIEIDMWACDTLRENFPETRVIERDIAEISSEEVTDIFRMPVDVVISGPPCQGFSVCGPSQKDPKDPRNSLFREFIRFLNILRPKAFLMENVPALLSRKTATGEHVMQVILRELNALDYYVRFKLLRACTYGVPQLRERLFILGTVFNPFRDPFPQMTHTRFLDTEGALEGKQPYITLCEAISDLPQIEAGEGFEPMNYATIPQNEYQQTMREGLPNLYNHIAMKHSRRMVERFSKMSYWNGRHEFPDELAPRVRGNALVVSSKRYSQNNRRMKPDRPCHTLPASFYANFLHPFLHRNFTPREGARIQSFPDRFIFKGKPTVVSDKLLAKEGRQAERHLCQYNQIGNAVPPILVRGIAERLLDMLQQYGRDTHV